jgi:hypothetical protein
MPQSVGYPATPQFQTRQPMSELGRFDPRIADMRRREYAAQAPMFEQSPNGWLAPGYTPPVSPTWEPGRMYDYRPGMLVGSTYDPTAVGAPVNPAGDRAEYLRDQQRRGDQAAQAAAWGANPAAPMLDPTRGSYPQLPPMPAPESGPIWLNRPARPEMAYGGQERRRRPGGFGGWGTRY